MARNDPILSPLTRATNADGRRAAIASLITNRVQPIVKRILSRFAWGALRPEDVDDLTSALQVRVLRRLQLLCDSSENVIEHLDDYVARLAYNVVNDYFRRRYPERMRLKNRLRYLLSRHPRFAVWEHEEESVCGVREWEGRPPARSIPAIDAGTLDRSAPAAAMCILFERAGGPLRLDDVVRIVAGAWLVPDPGLIDQDTSNAGEGTPERQLILRQEIERLWNEVQQLPAKQRAALLLNLRDSDGGNALSLVVVLGVASLDDVAAAAGIRVERLAQMWSDLPLDDLAIAAILGVTRQQVINLRKSARQRLARRTSRNDSAHEK